MNDMEFSAFLGACREELKEKQARFQQRIAGASRWFYEMESCSFFIGNERFLMTPVGTYSQEYQTWFWAWANPDVPPVAREASRKIQALHGVTGFQVFMDPGIQASPADVQNLTALAVHQLGAIGFFRSASEDGPVLYLAVHEPGSEDA